MPRALRWSWGGGLFLMSEVTLYWPARWRSAAFRTTRKMCGFIDSCITQLKAQGFSRTYNESKEEKKLHGYPKPLSRTLTASRRGGSSFTRPPGTPLGA